MILFDDHKADGDLSITLEENPMMPAKIKVVGVGGGGGNAVNRMIDANLRGIEFIAGNTDLQALAKCRAPHKLQLGKQITRGLGAGADPDVGRKSAIEDTDEILQILDGADMVFLTAGLGGGTGTGAVPIIASLAAQIGALTVAVVTKPFGFEGRRRMQLAEAGIEELRDAVDTVIAIPNERLLSFVERGTSLADAFLIADDVLRQAVQGISDLITIPGEVNADFADVRAIMSGMGMALMGTGIAKGENRALDAAQRAVSSPLLEDSSIQGARGVLINITGSSNLTLHEVAEAAKTISEAVDPDANIISGLVLDEEMEDEIKVTVIATGFGYERETDGAPVIIQQVPRAGRAASFTRDLEPPAPRREPVLPRLEPPRLTDPFADAPSRAVPQFDPPAEPARQSYGEPAPRPPMQSIVDPSFDEPAAQRRSDHNKGEDVPFYKKVLANAQPEDPGGFGPNWSSVDDYDIPTVLRKQMD